MKKLGRWVAAALVVSAIAASGAEAQERIVPERMQGIYDTYHYAPAVKVGNTIYASGVVAGHPDPETQFRQIFEGIRFVLGEAGAGLEDIVDMTTYHVNMGEHIETFMAVKDEFLTENYPAWTAIGVERLFTLDFLVEVKVVAVIPEG